MASLRVEALHKRFGEVRAIQRLSFDLPDGSFFCLLGPPGAGKTTTLRIIAGLEKADEGSVSLGGQPVDAVRPEDRDVAMIFEDLALYPHWTGFDNIAHPLKLRKLPKAEIAQRVGEVAERLHISHLLDRRPGTYSGGERRRLAIGRALVRQPRVLLLDEPLADLDAKIRQEMTAELKRLQTSTGQTMIYATHDFEEAMGMADQILVLHRGAEEQTGSPEEIYERPKTSFVASFVGSPAMNLMDCRAETHAGETRLKHSAFDLALGTAMKLPDVVTLGIRPEHLERVAEDQGCPARVDIVQVLGDEQILDMSLADGTVIKMISPLEPPAANEKPGRAARLAAGARMAIRFPLERIFLFDPTTGARLAGPGN